MSDVQAARGGRMVYAAEMQCFLCGHLAGSLETDRKPLPADGVWRPADGGDALRVADWRQLRCGRCGGALLAESFETIVKDDAEGVLRRELPRRGRPPKWLVEQRRRERNAAESRLG